MTRGLAVLIPLVLLLSSSGCQRHRAVIFHVISADTGQPIAGARISASPMKFLDPFAPGDRSGLTDPEGYWYGEVPRYSRTSIHIDAAGHESAWSWDHWGEAPPDLKLRSFGDFGKSALDVRPSSHPDGRPVYIVPLTPTHHPEVVVVFPDGFRGLMFLDLVNGPELATTPKPWAFRRWVEPNGTVRVPHWPMDQPRRRAAWSTGERFPGFNWLEHGRVCVYEVFGDRLFVVGKSEDWHRAHNLLWLEPSERGGPSRFDFGALDLLITEIKRRDTPLTIEDAERLIRSAKAERGLQPNEALGSAAQPPPCSGR